jgi:molybdopterin molybdotransferase
VFLSLKTIQEVKEIYKTYFSNLKAETEVIPTFESLERILAENIISDVDLPHFPRSTMDGFAVRAEDTSSATPSSPVYLKVTGEINMGEEAKEEVGSGEAVKIATGGMLPGGANAVVMLEYTEYLRDDTIEVKKAVGALENTVQVGEDIKRGEIILQEGELLQPQHIGVLAGIGVMEVKVYKRVKVGLISTGDELVEPHKSPTPGRIRNVNSYLIGSLIKQNGGSPILFGIVKDEFSLLREVAREALEECDLLLIIGGSSIGTRDLTRDVINSLGKPGVLVHGIGIKPGKPTLLGKVKGKPVIGLPGHPTSSMVVYIVVVQPLIDMIQGLKRKERKVKAKITQAIPSLIGREDYVRVKLKKEGDGWFAEPLFGSSAILSTILKADGLVKIGIDDEGLDESEEVEVSLL